MTLKYESLAKIKPHPATAEKLRIASLLRSTSTSRGDPQCGAHMGNPAQARPYARYRSALRPGAVSTKPVGWQIYAAAAILPRMNPKRRQQQSYWSNKGALRCAGQESSLSGSHLDGDLQTRPIHRCPLLPRPCFCTPP